MTCLLLPFIFWQIVFKHGGVEVETCFRDIFSQDVLLRHFFCFRQNGQRLRQLPSCGKIRWKSWCCVNSSRPFCNQSFSRSPYISSNLPNSAHLIRFPKIILRSVQVIYEKWMLVSWLWTVQGASEPSSPISGRIERGKLWDPLKLRERRW